MAELDKFEMMEVRTKKQEEERLAAIKRKKRNYIWGLSLTGVGIIVLIIIYVLAANVWLLDLVTLPYIEYSYSAQGNAVTATITRLKPNSGYPENFRIPAEVNGLKVTGIGDNAFAGCTRLKKVTMTDNITTIGDYAFSNCNNLASFEFSDNITHLGTGAFNGTKFIDSLDENSVNVVSQILFHVGSNVLKDNTVLLASHESNIPEQFQDSSKYNYVYFEDWGEHIAGWGEALFSGEDSLVYVEIPQYLEVVPTNTFLNCNNLVGVGFNNHTTTIADYAFSNTPNLINVSIDETVTTIGKYAFQNSGISEVVIPETITSIGEGAFKDCKNITTIDWPSHLNIPASTFSGCSNLTTFNIDEQGFKNISSIGSSAFSGTAIEKFTFPMNVGVVSTSLFENASKLKEVFLYEGHKEYDKQGLEDIVGVTRLEPYAFKNTSLESVVLIDNKQLPVSETGKVTFPKTLTNVATSNSQGEIFTGTSFTKFEFPAGVTKTSYQMFKNATNLKEVVFNSYHDGSSIVGMNFISYQTFYGCTGLETLIIPNTVKTIEEGAFQNASNLTTLILPDGSAGFSTIYSYVFSGLTKLKHVDLNNLTYTFKARAFENNYSMDYVYIPYSENGKKLSIERETFWNCRLVEEGQTLTEEEKMPIFLEFNEDEINKTYMPDPVVGSDGQILRNGWYDTKTCHVYWKDQWQMIDGVPTPIAGK